MIVAVGVFAMGEALWTAAHLRRKPVDVIPTGRPFLGRDDWRRSAGPWVLAARKGGDADEFGHGAIEGVAGPEAANNACAAGMFVPRSRSVSP